MYFVIEKTEKFDLIPCDDEKNRRRIEELEGKRFQDFNELEEKLKSFQEQEKSHISPRIEVPRFIQIIALKKEFIEGRSPIKEWPINYFDGEYYLTVGRVLVQD